MKRLKNTIKCTILILLVGILVASCRQNVVVIDDPYGEIGTPVSLDVELSQTELQAARENKLALIETTENGDGKEIPVQLDEDGSEPNSRLVGVIPNGKTGERTFKRVIKNAPFSAAMKVGESHENKQPLITEGDQKVLQYNYQMVYEKDVVRPGGEIRELKFSEMSSGLYYDEYLKAHPTFPKDTVVTSGIYSVPRSDYIHPLYGLNGEMLTRDWPDGGHPHHRGIFWAWPEVEYNGQRGDIYALQRVFARPTGKIEYINGPVYAQISAENQWMWEDEEPIVREQVYIRAYRVEDDARVVDLTLEFQALKENVTIATRFTDSYGGLNIRMQTPEDQEISSRSTNETDEKGNDPLRAWADFNGIFEGSKEKSGLMILQNETNPEYPGEWVEYPNLSWIQPTFPTPNTRFTLSTSEPLILKYRFVVHSGGKPTDDESKAYWDSYNSKNGPEIN